MEEFDDIRDAYQYAQTLAGQVGNGKVKMKCSKGKWFVWVAACAIILIGLGICIA
jgi:hypothetical protein